MKQLKNYFGECRIERNLWVFIIIMIGLIALCFFTSCSVQQIEPKPDFKIEWDSSKEDLLTPNKHDYKVLSYEYPYALVIRSDSIIEYKYSREPLAVGTCGISKKR